MRRQFAHAIDVFPTILELVGLDAPEEIGGVEQRPIEGTSFAYLLPDDAADAPEQHDTQYFEMFGSRGIYHRGWKAVTFKSLGTAPGPNDFDTPFDEDVWELFNVREDPSETRNLADDEPERARRAGRPLVGTGGALQGAPAQQSHPRRDDEPTTPPDPAA